MNACSFLIGPALFLAAVVVGVWTGTFFVRFVTWRARRRRDRRFDRWLDAERQKIAESEKRRGEENLKRWGSL